MKGLSEKQKRFAENVVLRNQGIEQAYRNAGYKGVPANCAHKIHAAPLVKRYMKTLSEAKTDEAFWDRDDLIKQAQKIAQGGYQRGILINGATRVSALSLLAKLQGFFPHEKHHHEHEHEHHGAVKTLMELVAEAQRK